MCPTATSGLSFHRRTFCYMTVVLSGAGLVLLKQASTLGGKGATSRGFRAVPGQVLQSRPAEPGEAISSRGRAGGMAQGSNRVRRLDSHLHVWAPKGSKEFPFYGPTIGSPPGDEPPVPGHVEVLLADMQGAGVEGALIVQPSNHLYDHSYVASVLRRYPEKFVGCALANPTLSPDAAAGEIERLARQDGFRAVRFNPYLWPDGRRMNDQVGHAIFAKCAELDLVASFMTFKGLLLHVEDIRELAEAHPDVAIILDHAAFVKSGSPGSAEWLELLSLASLPKIYVKLSAFFRLSAEPYPFLDARLLMSDLVAAFGADRLMWGSDFPWVNQQYGYKKAWHILEAGDEALGEALLSETDARFIMAGTLQHLFPGAWPLIS
eukprot:jgi/Botrbrau1/6858/Bobra.152_2s0017.1